MPQAPEGLSDLIKHAPAELYAQALGDARPLPAAPAGSEALFRERCSGLPHPGARLPRTGGGQGPPAALVARPRAMHGYVPGAVTPGTPKAEVATGH